MRDGVLAHAVLREQGGSDVVCEAGAVRDGRAHVVRVVLLSKHRLAHRALLQVLVIASLSALARVENVVAAAPGARLNVLLCPWRP